MSRTLSASQARRIVLAAQGLAAPAPEKPVTRRAVRALAERLGFIQLDSVNVFVRAHYMPLYARLGGHPASVLDEEAWGKRPGLFEFWGHAASLMPIDMQPLFRWKMERARTSQRASGLPKFGRENRAYIDEVLAEVRRRGPVTGGDFAPEERRQPGWWNWSEGKSALEWLFWAGLITTRTRRGFERVYDLTERVIPARILDIPTPSVADAQRELVRVSAQAMGVATLADLADNFSLLQSDARARVRELIEAGTLEEVRVEGWRTPGYLAAGVKLPRRASGAALLAPFDNLIWRRERTERLFGLRYRIGIYTPAAQREHGYYVYPFLLGEKIAARVDLKADRKAGALLVQAAHLEPGSREDEVLAPLAEALARAAAWQGLGEVTVAKKGGLATALSRKFD
jgi:uncharacterized protein YcaQ